MPLYKDLMIFNVLNIMIDAHTLYKLYIVECFKPL